MKGKVTAQLEARLKLQLKGPRNGMRTISAVIDTGYSGTLTLPPKVIKFLALLRVGQSAFTLADGSRTSFDVYLAMLKWDGRMRLIYVDEAPAEPLVGMRLLLGHDLAVRVRRGGMLSITRY